ncbi:MAG: response regulator [Thermoanaerobaculales bacterium]
MAGTLLLADDSITIQKVVELTFAETDHTVIAVGSGRDLFDRLPEIKPDVVLCDVVMPDMNGYEVCQLLKSDPATLHIPVILLTGTFEPFDRDRALAAGCDAIVTKPFEARDLVNLVEDFLKRAQAVAATPAPSESAGLGELGVPEGVQALDYSTTGFDRMVPSPPVEPGMPDDGIELTASSLGDSHPKAAAVVPPELQEEAPSPESAFAFGARVPPVRAPETPVAGPDAAQRDTPLDFATEVEAVSTRESEDETHPHRRAIAPERFPVADEEPGFPVETLPAPASLTEMTPFSSAPPAGAPPAPDSGAKASADAGFASVSDDALFTAPDWLPSPGQARAPQEPAHPASVVVPEVPLTVEPEPSVAPVAAPISAPPSPTTEPMPAVAAVPLSEADVEGIVRRVLEAVAGANAGEAAAPRPELDEEQVERIARRVMELASPKIERIAWEVIPDMAEMLVRKRITDLERASEEEN